MRRTLIATRPTVVRIGLLVEGFICLPVAVVVQTVTGLGSPIAHRTGILAPVAMFTLTQVPVQVHIAALALIHTLTQLAADQRGPKRCDRMAIVAAASTVDWITSQIEPLVGVAVTVVVHVVTASLDAAIGPRAGIFTAVAHRTLPFVAIEIVKIGPACVEARPG